MGDQRGNVTALLRQWVRGDEAALEALMPVVYDELHRMASRFLKGERPGHTLRPTELVAEAYLRLAGGEGPDVNDRLHFYGVCARTMRRILVDHARGQRAAKRGAGQRAVTLDEGLLAGERPEELVLLDEALAALAVFDARAARAVELHYFGGLSHDEIASALGVAVRTVARDLRAAEAWMRKHIEAVT